MRQGFVSWLAAAACLAALAVRRPERAPTGPRVLHLRRARRNSAIAHPIAVVRAARAGSLWSDIANLCLVQAAYGAPQAYFGATMKFEWNAPAPTPHDNVIAFEPARAAALRVRKQAAFWPPAEERREAA